MRKVVVGIVIALLTVLVFRSLKTEAGVSEQDFRSFLAYYEAKAIPLSTASAIYGFDASLSGKDADYQKSAQAAIALRRVYADTEAFARLKAFRDGGKIADPLLKRQLDVLYLAYLGNQIDAKILEELVNRQTALAQKFYTYRTVVAGQTLSDNQIDSILSYSTNTAQLEQTWEASKKIGREVADEVIALVKLRNRAAQSMGFSDYYEMQLRLNEQDPAEIAALFDQLDSLTNGAYVALKGRIDSALAAHYGVTTGELRPWHYQNRFFQDAPRIYDVDMDLFYRTKDPVAITRDYFAGIGLPVDSILARSDLYERPGKYQHAYSTDMDRSGDVRLVCNIRPDHGGAATMLHELGHGVYDYYNDRQAPWLLRGAAHAFTTEAVANFFGRLADNPKWLVQVAGTPQAEVDRVADQCVQMLRLRQLAFSRWCQVMVRFERALYENPDQDLNKLWWDLVEKYQRVNRPAGRNEPDWASKIHIVDAPVYYHNYLIAELLASQFAETIGREVLKSPEPFDGAFAGDPRIGQFFIDKVFHPGNRYPWNEMIERATGEKLTSVYYARQFVEAGGK